MWENFLSACFIFVLVGIVPIRNDYQSKGRGVHAGVALQGKFSQPTMYWRTLVLITYADDMWAFTHWMTDGTSLRVHIALWSFEMPFRQTERPTKLSQTRGSVSRCFDSANVSVGPSANGVSRIWPHGKEWLSLAAWLHPSSNADRLAQVQAVWSCRTLLGGCYMSS